MPPADSRIVGTLNNIRDMYELSLLVSGERQLAARAGNALVPLTGAGGAIEVATPYGDGSDPLARLLFSEMFGGDLDELPVTRDRAIRIGAAAKGRDLICGQIGALRLVHMTSTTRTAQQPRIVTQPEAGRPYVTSLTWWADSMLWYGRAWLVVTERYSDSNGGKPSRFQWVPEWSAEVDTAGRLVKAFGRSVAEADVVRIDGPHEGILNRADDAIREHLAFDLAAGNAAENPVPSINLQQTGGQPLTTDQIKDLLATWRAARRKRGGGVGYSNASIKPEVLGQPVEQLLIAGRNNAALNIARHMSLPGWAVDAVVQGTSLNYTSVTGRSRELIDYTLRPYLDAIAQRLSLDDVLPAGQWVRFDTSGVLMGNFAERMAGYKAAIDAGIYTAEECKAIEAGYALEGTY